MKHEGVAPLVSDWVRGTLDATRAAAVERHVRDCPQCSEAAEAARTVERVRAAEAAAPSTHPSSDALARYVVSSADEPVAALASVGLHLGRCATCRAEVELMRGAAAPGWWRTVRAWVGGVPAGNRLLQPALAIAAVLLVYPAWVGLVQAPRERAEAERALRVAEQAKSEAEIAAEEARARAEAMSYGGGVAALVLQETVRSGPAAPTLRVREGQVLQPILLDVSPPAGNLRVALLRGETSLWSVSGPRADFWDDVNRLVGILVPAALLVPGEYVVELSGDQGGPPFFTARFRIAPKP